MADDGAADAHDTVEAFATRIERALHDLRVDVAGMRPEPTRLHDAVTVDTGTVLDVDVDVEPPAAPVHDGPVEWRIPWDVEAPEEPEPATHRRGRRVLTIVAVAFGAAIVLAILFVSVGPRVLPYRTYAVRSGSMEPAIDTGALVVLTEVDAEELEPGDIVTFRRPNDEAVLVTHRIVGVESDGSGSRVFVTKGDANRDVDPWRVPGTGIGWRYAFDVSYAGYVFGALGSAPVRVVLVVVPAAALALLARPGARRRRAAHAA